MNNKLDREIYRNAEYTLNSQEIKEFRTGRRMTYRNVRSICHIYKEPLFGTKERGMQEVEFGLFTGSFQSYPSAQRIRSYYGVDIYQKEAICAPDEMGVESVETKTRESGEARSLREEIRKELESVMNNPDDIYTYKEIENAIWKFTDEKMVFYNYLKNGILIPPVQEKEPPSIEALRGNGSLTLIVYFPYLPKHLIYFSNEFIAKLLKYLNIHTKYKEGIGNEILRQKLLDLFYLAEDSPNYHLVTNCQTNLLECNSLASQFCANYMCRDCCGKTQHRLPCMIHDKQYTFYTFKIKCLLEFERYRKLNVSQTLRVRVRRRITRHKLTVAFSDYEVEWEKTELFFNPLIQKIQYIYILFKTALEARRAYHNRESISKAITTSGHSHVTKDIKIEPCYEPLESIKSKVKETHLEATLVLFIPPTSTDIEGDIPHEGELLARLRDLFSMIFGEEQSERIISVQYGRNMVSKKWHSEEVIAVFGSFADAERIYRAQPYYKHIVAHKLTHLSPFPYIMPPNLCLMCSSPKNTECIHDLCDDCCTRQASHWCSHCPPLPQQPLIFEEPTEERCIICGHPSSPITPKCSNQMCALCCSIQMSNRRKCHLHDRSIYINKLVKISEEFEEFVKEFRRGIMMSGFGLRYALREGLYHWFRPIHGTDVTDIMIKNNQLLVDSYSKKDLMSGNCKSEILEDWGSLTNGRDAKGREYLEYNYKLNTHNGLESDIHAKSKSTDNKDIHYDVLNSNPYHFSTMLNKRQLDFALQPILDKSLIQSFHIFLTRLDANASNNREELRTKIYHELLHKVGKIQLDNIEFLDSHSLLNVIGNSIIIEGGEENSVERGYREMGTICIAKFTDIQDAVRSIAEPLNLNLPSTMGIDGEKGTVSILPSHTLIDYIHSHN